MKKIKIAQIGTSRNSHGMMIFESLAKQPDLFEIIGYALPENEREKFPERMKAFEGYKEMTVDEILNNPEIEAVTIETEELYLTKYALMAAEHGKHIHMEKPGSPSFEDFKKLIETVKSNKTAFHIGYMYRYNPVIINLMNEIKNGDLGKIISVDAQMSCLYEADGRQWLDRFPGGMLYFLGCHLIDLIFRIKGKPENIIPLSKATGVDGTTAQDFGMVAFEYKNGVSTAKSSSMETGGFARRQLVVTGSKKTVDIRPLEFYAGGDDPSEQFTEKTEFASKEWGNRGELSRSEVFNRYDAMMESFGKIVLGEKVNPYSYDYELELFEIIMKSCGAM